MRCDNDDDHDNEEDHDNIVDNEGNTVSINNTAIKQFFFACYKTVKPTLQTPKTVNKVSGENTFRTKCYNAQQCHRCNIRREDVPNKDGVT